MASLTAALDNIVREEIAQGIREMRPDIDPIWSEIFTTSMGVTREGLGRTWLFKKTYTSGISGAYEFVPNATMIGNDPTIDIAQLKMFAEGNGWPGRVLSTAPSFPQATISLVEARGNTFVPMQWLQLDQFDSSIGSAFKELIKGTAFKAALAHATAFYTSDADNFKVISSLAASSAAATHNIEIDNNDAAKASGRIQMLHNGSLVDIYTTDTKQNVSPWYVSKVDYLNNTFTITETVSADTNTAIDAEDYLTLGNSRGSGGGSKSNAPEGLRSWMVTAASSTLVMDRNNGIDTGDHPEYGSLLVTESGPLTGDMLNKHVGTFMERIGTMCTCDTLITTAGVTHAYLANSDNLGRFERQGKALDLKGGWSNIGYGYHGVDFKWGISSFSEPGTVFILKTGNQNIKEFVPPSIPGAGSSTDFSNEIQFVAQLGGATSIWLHERTSGAAITDVMEAPFLRQCQLCPDYPQGIIISGLDETVST